MPSQKRYSLTQHIRRLDSDLRMESWRNYVNFITVVLEDFPIEVNALVLKALRLKDYGLLLRWADSFGGAVHATVEEQSSASQLAALIKKYPFPAPELKLNARTLAKEKFLAAENRCKRYNLKFKRLNSGRFDRRASLHHRMEAWIAKVIGFSPDLPAIYDECGFGPGASLGVHGQNTNLARKLLSREWSCTPGALPYAVSALAQNDHLWELLNPRDGRYFCYDYSVFEKSCTERTRLVHNNNIVFVPKTTLVDRTIAVEPLLNGYLQKGVDVFMRQRLKRVGIDLRDQTRNQELARQGSLPGQTDPYVTIDLSSASDSISTEVVRRFLPPDWFDFLNCLRAKSYKLDDLEVRYEKFVSMGNGFCFPLETLLFASVCHAVGSDDFTVYGDDIIVKQSKAHAVLELLRSLGFRHNPNKTFLEGPFRESCGADWFAGHDVRPLTLDYAFDSVESIIKFHNMSLRKDLWSFRFDKVRKNLLELVPPKLRLVRPFIGTVDSAFEVPEDVFSSSPFAKWSRKTFTWSWLEFVKRSAPDKGIERHERYNIALMMGALNGSMSNVPFAKRRETSRTIRRLSYAGADSTWLPAQSYP